MEIIDYELSAPLRNLDALQRIQGVAMIKEHNNLSQLAQSKGQEFIDHTLLAPGYIRDPNNFIMDLMDQQVFQKQSPSTAVFVSKESVPLISEMNFQHDLFQFVNKDGQIQNSTSATAAVSLDDRVVSTDTSGSFNSKEHANFIGLDDNFLSVVPTASKSFCADNDDVVAQHYSPLEAAICNLAQPPMSQNVPALDLLDAVTLESSSALIEEAELCATRANSRKLLPHKKRISKKLKVQHSFEPSAQGAVAALAPKAEANELQLGRHVMQFSCELCGHSTSSQLQFFAHLKLHYEPTASSKNDLKTTMSEVQTQPSNCHQIIKDESMRVDRVFQDVHINFDDLEEVGNMVKEAIAQKSANANTKELDAHSLNKCLEIVTASCADPPKIGCADEIEFSDTEDMLEGIRNVVDKVSIEDTSDAIELGTSGNIRTAWFAHNSFDAISFKTKPDDSKTAATTFPTDQFETLKDSKSANFLDLSVVGMKVETPDNFNECKTIAHESSKTLQPNIAKSTKAANATEPKKPVHVCNKCHREFNSSNALKYHHRTHTGVRPHQCDTCGRSFYAQGALKSHILTHTGDKPYECEYCHRYFRQMGDLKYHVSSIHNHDKSHQCEFCGKAFARKYSLVLHRRIHTSERNYKCEFCPKTFRASIYLQNHRKIHTGEKPYQCETCTKKFRVSGDLRRHLRIHQRKEIKKETEPSS